MKNKQFLTVILFGALTLSNGCAGNNPTNGEQSSNNSQPTATTEAQPSDLQKAVASDFADQVVIPTYRLLVQKADGLSKTVDAFVSNPDDNTLKAAQEAWRATRVPWEQSEAFAFGPATSLGYDGDLDDWPVNEADVTAVLKDKTALTPESVDKLQTTQKGFHTIEYLLFGLKNDRKASDLTERDRQFLKLLSENFNETANNLLKSWTEEVGGNPPYRQVLATAGDSSNSAYPTTQAALEEIVQGMMGCLDEVANEKIAEPLKEKTTKGFESRFSYGSLTDFKNNVRSAENAYLGKVAEANTSGKSVSEIVAQKNPDLDKQVKAELQAAIAALDAVPDPIEPKLSDAAAYAKLQAAQKAVSTAYETVEQKVLPIVQG